VAALCAVGAVAAFVLWRRQGTRPEGGALSLGNPVELGHAFLLALLFAGVLLATRVAQARLGQTGLWTVSAIGGLVDVDAVAVASARLRQQDVVNVRAAAGAYLLATLANLGFKAAVVLATGGTALARRVIPALLPLAAATVAALLV
jgi:uncharacterized membrane protein (DUF4010 family)